MKKQFIILLICLSAAVNAQNRVRINVADITGTDSTYYIQMNKSTSPLIEFFFTTLNANDATIEVGIALNTARFFPLTLDIDNPLTLDKTDTSLTRTQNGITTSAFHVFAIGSWPGTLLAITITKNSVTTGSIYIYY